MKDSVLFAEEPPFKLLGDRFACLPVFYCSTKEEIMKWTGYVSWHKASINGKDTIEKASVEGSSFREITDYIEDFGEDVIVEVHIQRERI
jgi:hypothetical protein